VRKATNEWKLPSLRVPIAQQTDFSKPFAFYWEANVTMANSGECYPETHLVGCAFDTESEVTSFKTDLFTKIARFLLLQSVISQDVTRESFCFTPDLEKYEGEYTDDKLGKRWGIAQEEWEPIDSRITDLDPSNEYSPCHKYLPATQGTDRLVVAARQRTGRQSGQYHSGANLLAYRAAYLGV